MFSDIKMILEKEIKTYMKEKHADVTLSFGGLYTAERILDDIRLRFSDKLEKYLRGKK